MDEEEFADMDAKMVTYLFSFKTYYYFVSSSRAFT